MSRKSVGGFSSPYFIIFPFTCHGKNGASRTRPPPQVDTLPVLFPPPPDLMPQTTVSGTNSPVDTEVPVLRSRPSTITVLPPYLAYYRQEAKNWRSGRMAMAKKEV
ncbi:hypothetical protein AVEN_36547-1 [Araneus ventricosus]|uniref:Uncharacterized protein n=1 Tax=Araneus ventricosus TaxID=182803 RepID=A0A4Y2MC61_ARAVE|nr:hypothetical protein AVEN_36547-1 [Araneus ventricosus]